MIIGYTGTRMGMTPTQQEVLMAQLHRLGATELHHGDCQGGDAQAHAISRQLGLRIVGHPPIGDGLRAFCVCDEMREPKDFLLRNRDIVQDTRILLGTPDGPERVRSGTWSALRFAKRSGRPWMIIAPDGDVTEPVPRNPEIVL